MIWAWVGFIALVLVLLGLDLGVFHRKDHVIKTREALAWTGVWIVVALLFSIFIYFGYQNHWMGMGKQLDVIDKSYNNGASALVKYLTGYVIEKSLSVDNIFVIALIFSAFAIPPVYQHRVLFWGILGAIAMRGAMIGFSAQLVKYHFVIWIFAGILILTAIRMLWAGDEEKDPHDTRTYRLAKRLFPFTANYYGHAFSAMENGKRVFTPLALALVMVETTDLIFAVDSIPAIFAITGDPYLVFTSNIFAILGLRSLYFALAGMMDKFRYLKIALAIVLLVVGVKMITAKWLKDWLGAGFNFYLLGLVFLILIIGVAASMLASHRETKHAARLGMETDPAGEN